LIINPLIEVDVTYEVGSVNEVFFESELDPDKKKPRRGERTRPRAVRQGPGNNITIGELIALTDNGSTPLVVYRDQPGTAAIAARTVVDLSGQHIGRPLVLMFEDADPMKPLVMGVLRTGEAWPIADQPGQVEVDADGNRLIVSAKEQLVFRCGKASITLTRAGKVLIDGTYILSRSSGANRIKGGSVEIN
jgi:Domain of unknown function (DUF6484)